MPCKAKKAFRGKTECLPVPDEGSHISYGDGGHIMVTSTNALKGEEGLLNSPMPPSGTF
jgi:hypothetical protein